MRVHLSRWVCLDPASNLERLEREGDAAAAAGAGLVLFPESFLHGYTGRLDPAEARRRFARLSCDHPQVLFVFGSLSEEGRNRLTAWIGGREAARYDKVHLFEPNGETNLWQAGARYAALRALGRTWGFLTCNDLRFPEQARLLRLKARCDALLVPAWWPWRRDHVWRTLLRARAIENNVWVLGCCVAACEAPQEPFAGAGNYAFDPAGEPVRTSDDRTYELDLDSLPEPVVDTSRTYAGVEDVQIFEG
jgi:omega-amidase